MSCVSCSHQHSVSVREIYFRCSQDFHINILKASGSNLDLIKNKYKIPFRDFKCPGEYFEPNNESALLSVDFVQFEIQRLLDLDRIAECPLKPYCCNPLSVASKLDSNGRVKLWLVLDLSRHINNFIDSPSVKLDDLSIIEQSLKKDIYMWSFDLKDQFHQIQVHEQFQKNFGFQFINPAGEWKYYVYKVLPFGLNMAVSLVTNIFKPFKAYLNSLNITNFIYIDDGFIINPDSKLLSDQIKFVLSVLV